MKLSAFNKFSIFLVIFSQIGCGVSGYNFSHMLTNEKNDKNSSTQSSPIAQNEPIKETAPSNTVFVTQEFTVPSVSNDKADILFCVDNSGSMADKQYILSSHFQNFIEATENSGMNLHIGIVSSDVINDNGAFKTKYPGEYFLTSETPSLIEKFQNNVKLGTKGSNYEQCIRSITLGLSPNNHTNAGFLRNDAILSIIFITDEDEFIAKNENVDSRIQELQNRLRQIKGDPTKIKISYFINLKAKPPKADEMIRPDFMMYPSVYLKASENVLQGTIKDVTTDFSEEYVNIASQLQFSNEPIYKLTSLPKSKIEIEIDGMKIKNDSKNGWVYNKANNSIELRGSSIIENQNRILKISYKTSE